MSTLLVKYTCHLWARLVCRQSEAEKSAEQQPLLMQPFSRLHRRSHQCHSGSGTLLPRCLRPKAARGEMGSAWSLQRNTHMEYWCAGKTCLTHQWRQLWSLFLKHFKIFVQSFNVLSQTYGPCNKVFFFSWARFSSLLRVAVKYINRFGFSHLLVFTLCYSCWIDCQSVFFISASQHLILVYLVEFWLFFGFLFHFTWG